MPFATATNIMQKDAYLNLSIIVISVLFEVLA